MGKTKSHGNGQGTAYPWHGAWMAAVVLGYETVERPDGTFVKRARRRRKGGFKTKREALAYCETLRKGAAKPERKPMNFIQVYEAWEKAYADKIVKSTLNCYRAAKKYFADLYFWPFDQIGVEDLQACIDECPCGKRTRENMKATASLMYQWAVPRHYADMNYAEYLIPGGDQGGTRPPFTAAQVAQIWQGAATVPHADFILALIYTGFRPTELLNLRRTDYRTAEDGVEYLVGGIKTEAGKARAVTIAPRIRPILQQRLAAADPWLFPRDDGQPCTEAYFRENYFYPALEALGIQQAPAPGAPAYLTPYSCRHTFSNLLKDAKGAGKDKAALIGHENYTTTEKLYQAADLENMKAITDQF